MKAMKSAIKGVIAERIMRLGADIISYFKSMAKDMGVPYQNLIAFNPIVSSNGWLSSSKSRPVTDPQLL